MAAYPINGVSLTHDGWRHLKRFIQNRLSLTVIGGNFVGACTCMVYFMWFDRVLATVDVRGSLRTSLIMFAFLVVLGGYLTRKWEKDIFRFLSDRVGGGPIAPDLQARAGRKFLNLPYISASISMINWALAALIMTTLNLDLLSAAKTALATWFEAIRIFLGIFFSGVVTSALIFFTTELQTRKFRPYFFPDGGLVGTPGVLRLNLRWRMHITLALSALLPMVLLAVLSYNRAAMMVAIDQHMDPQTVLRSLFFLTGFLLIVAVILATLFSHLVWGNIIEPVEEMENAMRRVAKGDLDSTVKVTTNDELGALSDFFNLMVAGLQEHTRLQHSLALAEQVQRNLLPRAMPEIPGLDVAGASLYCDQTGGDYYDFINLGDDQSNLLGVVVGDVSDHGISSALLMATARSALRQRAAMAGALTDIVTDVNRQLARDIEDAGHFLTLFFGAIDSKQRQISWVNAGHEPGLIYDPQTDRFTELGGKNLPLGVFDDITLVDSHHPLAPGQIVVIATDGVWETSNNAGQLFGKKRFCDIIRNTAQQSAREIIDAVFSAVRVFGGELAREDDVTLVVLKILQSETLPPRNASA